MQSPQMQQFKRNRDKKMKGAKERYDFERGAISATHIINLIMPDIKKFFRGKSVEKQEQINAFIRLMYGYLTSRSPLSGKFVIAK